MYPQRAASNPRRRSFQRVDARTEDKWYPLANLAPDQASFIVAREIPIAGGALPAAPGQLPAALLLDGRGLQGGPHVADTNPRSEPGTSAPSSAEQEPIQGRRTVRGAHRALRPTDVERGCPAIRTSAVGPAGGAESWRTALDPTGRGVLERDVGHPAGRGAVLEISPITNRILRRVGVLAGQDDIVPRFRTREGRARPNPGRQLASVPRARTPWAPRPQT
jgi:hypothetical protein